MDKINTPDDALIHHFREYDKNVAALRYLAYNLRDLSIINEVADIIKRHEKKLK